MLLGDDAATEAIFVTPSPPHHMARRLDDEHIALGAAVAVIAIVSIIGTVLELQFLTRSVFAVGAGLIVLFVVNYSLTGQFIPSDEET